MDHDEDPCNHLFTRDGEVRRRLSRDGFQTWAKYVCQSCLTPRFALISEYNGYTGSTTTYDGTRIVKSMEDLP